MSDNNCTKEGCDLKQLAGDNVGSYDYVHSDYCARHYHEYLCGEDSYIEPTNKTGRGEGNPHHSTRMGQVSKFGPYPGSRGGYR